MNKRPFIPKDYRPNVPGSKLQEPEGGNYTFSKLENVSECIVIISSKEDIVPDAFLREIDTCDGFKRLFYDDLGTSWDFIFSNGGLKFFTHDGMVIPKSIYQRHPGVSKKHPYYQKHIAFFEVLDLWKGNLIGQRRDHHHNTSKAYQAITSIRNASKRIAGNGVAYPRSFFIKTSLKTIPQFNGEMIVKSCSNIRSQVVSQSEFNKWDASNVRHLPTLFQEKVDGKDVRVHVCKNNFWTLLVDSKDCVDYRYASKGSIKYQSITLPDDVIAFCKSMSHLEENKLIGVDLIKTAQGYFCLESNPGPGWSTFNHPTKKKFAQEVFNELLNHQ